MSSPSNAPSISASPPIYSTNTPPPHYCIDPTNGGKVYRTFAPSDEAHSGRYFRQEPRKSYRPTNTARGWYIISSIWSNGQHRWSRTPQLIRGHHRGQNTSKVFHHFFAFCLPFSGSISLCSDTLPPKLEGRLQFLSSERGSRTVATVSETYTLWNCSRTEIESCPSSLSFSFFLPPAYKDGGTSYPLPPTFQAAFTAGSELVVTSVYTVIASTTAVRRPVMLGFDKMST